MTLMLSDHPPAEAVHLAHRWLEDEPRQALANFTWVNNVTLGAKYCRFAYQMPDHCLAQHMALPFSAIAMVGNQSPTLRALVSMLLKSPQTAYSLVPQDFREVIAASFVINEMRLEWQLLFEGDAQYLDPGLAQRLQTKDLPAMNALAATDEVMVFGADTFARGIFYGVFVGEQLVSMGGVQTQLPGMSEIGSIVTHPEYRRRGYATQVVSALVHHLSKQHIQIFLCLFQSNQLARHLYEKLGFHVVNELTLVNWALPD